MPQRGMSKCGLGEGKFDRIDKINRIKPFFTAEAQRTQRKNFSL